MKRAMLIVFTLLLATAVFAAEKPNAPAPPAANLRLARLVGTWTGDAEFKEGEKAPVKMKVRIECHEASGGWGVKCDTSMTSPKSAYLETDLFGYDASTDKVHWYSVTSAGEVHDHVGSWNENGGLAIRYTGRSGSDDLIEDVTLGFEGAKQMSFDVVTTVAGAQVSTGHTAVTRR